MIIANTELAIVQRLRQGLGRMVHGVESYGGELDGEPAEIVRQLPAAWVTFGGIQKTENVNLTKRKYKSFGRFVVIVGDRNLRSENAARLGGPGVGEVGTYRLVTAVRRLLSGQDMTLPIQHLIPGRVRTLFNTKVEAAALSVFACEFDTAWIEEALEENRFPLVDAPDEHPDSLFNGFGGIASADDPEWLRTHLNYDIPQSAKSPDAVDIIDHE